MSVELTRTNSRTRRIGAVALIFTGLATMTARGEAVQPVTRRIAITFDDAPRPAGAMFDADERARRLIAELKSAGVAEATFFVKTSNIRTEADRDRLRRYVAAGHRLANHSHSHLWLRRTDVQEYVTDIEKAHELLAEFDGYDPFYRFPFLDEGRSVEQRDAVRAALVRLDLAHGYVTVDNYDWYLAGKLTEAVKEGLSVDRDSLRQVYLEHVLESVSFYDGIALDVLGRSPAHVLLLHENDLAALFVGDLVRALRENGWQILSASEAYEDPIAEMLPDTLFNGQGRVAALAHVAGAEPRSLVQASEDERYLDEQLERRAVFTAASRARTPSE